MQLSFFSWFKHILFRRKGLGAAYNATMPSLALSSVEHSAFLFTHHTYSQLVLLQSLLNYDGPYSIVFIPVFDHSSPYSLLVTISL